MISISRRTLLSLLLLASLQSTAQLQPGSLTVRWNEGASDCSKNPPPPLQVHAYNPQTYILRESLCATFEAPFMYLLIGSQKALLIDSGDVADPAAVPLASTVMQLLSGTGSAKPFLIVVHTHRHLDHRAGDPQFQNVAGVQVVGFDLDSVRRFYNFTDWPNGIVQIDLGDRTVDAISTPGHSETEVSFYDRNTGLFFSGDFLLPGRMLIDDASADLSSAQRVAAFAKDRPVSFVLGGHIEMDEAGELFPWQSSFHPHEHVLQLTKDDLLVLPATIQSFNGFYTVRGKFVMMNSLRLLAIFAGLIAIGLIVLIWILVRYVRRCLRKRKKFPAAA
jgi:glyoxylase-like metal-dependent hydrolase (beta-lactamase superfamily II)